MFRFQGTNFHPRWAQSVGTGGKSSLSVKWHCYWSNQVTCDSSLVAFPLPWWKQTNIHFLKPKKTSTFFFKCCYPKSRLLLHSNIECILLSNWIQCGKIKSSKSRNYASAFVMFIPFIYLYPFRLKHPKQKIMFPGKVLSWIIEHIIINFFQCSSPYFYLSPLFFFIVIVHWAIPQNWFIPPTNSGVTLI